MYTLRIELTEHRADWRWSCALVSGARSVPFAVWGNFVLRRRLHWAAGVGHTEPMSREDALQCMLEMGLGQSEASSIMASADAARS